MFFYTSWWMTEFQQEDTGIISLILNLKWYSFHLKNKIGITCGPHKVYNTITVLDYAGGMTSKAHGNRVNTGKTNDN